MEFYLIWFLIGMSLTMNFKYQGARLGFFILYGNLTTIESSMYLRDTEWFLYSASPYTIRETKDFFHGIFPVLF